MSYPMFVLIITAFVNKKMVSGKTFAAILLVNAGLFLAVGGWDVQALEANLCSAIGYEKSLTGSTSNASHPSADSQKQPSKMAYRDHFFIYKGGYDQYEHQVFHHNHPFNGCRNTVKAVKSSNGDDKKQSKIRPHKLLKISAFSGLAEALSDTQ